MSPLCKCVPWPTPVAIPPNLVFPTMQITLLYSYVTK